jgi:hypothetical protein
VPEEFAAAYRAAYEEALRAQSVPSKQGDHADRAASTWLDSAGLPVRTRPIRVGTHRGETGTEPSAYERARDSVWFVPALLLALAALLLIGAYVAGRMFASHVGT